MFMASRSGVPKTFNDLPEGLVELGKAVMLTFMAYCSETMLIRICKDKSCLGQGPEDTRHGLPIVLSLWNPMDALNSLFSQQ